MAASSSAVKLPRIREVRAYAKKESADQGADCHDVVDKHWINGYPTPVSNPMTPYPLYRAQRKLWGINAMGSVVVEVESEDGSIGVGVSIGGPPACYIIENHLSRFIEGQDPSNVELMWDQMFRSTLNYGRKGLPLQAISAVDLAVWDLLGKLRKEPVYSLLGGKTKDYLPVYCTSSRPDNAKDFGFVGAKIPCAYGPTEGVEGFKKNVELFKNAREKVGPDFPLMLDCYMSLSVPYAVKLGKALEPYNLKWIEECLPPDDYTGYTSLKSSLTGTTLVTTGEHEYTRYGFRQLLEGNCADIIQPDITWLGGITEARRVVALASSYDIPVIPHGSSIYSYHLQYAFANCPLAEYINLSPESDRIVSYFGGLFPDEPLPANGVIQLPDRPGFGVTLDNSGLTRPYPRSPDQEEISKQVQVVVRSNGQVITLRNPCQETETKSFQFDYTYGLNSDDNGYLQPLAHAEQKLIFVDLVPRLLRNAWKGYNCTLFAYGQRGTGKSYSIFGNKSSQGAISAVCEKLFEQVVLAKDTLCQISVSLMEIYNDEVRDLLDTGKQNILKVRENQRTGYYVDGLKVVAMAAYSDIERILKEGMRNRALLTTEMNSLSTHSTTVIFQVRFVQKYLNRKGRMINKTSLISFIDLPAAAGSGMVNDSLERNLLALHNVIEALVDNKEVKVPFNDSALTKLLKPILSGNSKITFIVTLSPTGCDYKESMKVLKFAEQLRKIVINAEVNESVTDEILHQLREENAELLMTLRNDENLELKYSDPKEFKKLREKKKKAVYKIIQRNEAEIEEMKKTWEEKLSIAQKILKATELREIEFEHDKDSIPYLWNVHEDPLLTGTIVYFLQPVLCYTVGAQTGSIEDDPDIPLNGLSIQQKHAVITNEGREGTVSLSPCSNSKILVNGKLVNGTVTLHHNDRIILGCHHLYVLNHPREVRSLPILSGGGHNKLITYRQALEDIAVCSGYTAGNEIKEELFRILPMVYEANIISEELDKKLSFEIVSLPLQRNAMNSETKLMIKRKQLVTGRMSLWSMECFCSRYIAMKDIYKRSINGYGLLLSNEEDPFWEADITEVLLGQAYAYMQYLPYMVEMEDTVSVLDLDGQKLGQLKIHVCPCQSHSLGIDSSIENTDDILGKRIQFQFKIISAHNLPEKTMKGAFCKFHFFLDANDSVTETITDTVSPSFNYTKEVVIDPVTPSTLHTLKYEPLVIEVWVKEKEQPEWEPTGIEDSMKLQMDTKELMERERQTRGCPLVIRTLRKQTVKIETEVMKSKLATMKAKVEQLEASVKRVEDLIIKAEEKNDEKILLLDLQNAVKNDT